MTPPKITRPAVPEVKHEFPAWYVSRSSNITAFLTSEKKGKYYDHIVGDFLTISIDPDVFQCWERLPSGSKIEFTQP